MNQKINHNRRRRILKNSIFKMTTSTPKKKIACLGKGLIRKRDDIEEKI